MKKGFWLTVLAVLLTAAVIIVPIINSEYTRSENKASSGVQKSPEKIIDDNKKKDPQKEAEPVTQDETVVFFVQLDEPPILDAALGSDEQYSDILGFMLSDEGKDRSETVKKSQAVARAGIKKLVSKADLSDSRAYSAIFNAITVKAPLSSKSKLEGVGGVSSVCVLYDSAELFDNDDESDETEKTVSDSQGLRDVFGNLISPDNDFSSGGSGTLIAVLDDGFNTDNPAFLQAPSGQKLSQKTLKELFENIKFDASPEDVYVSSKIPFAFDYAGMTGLENDPEHSHGTSVAAIAAGNNGSQEENAYRGVAFDAQLALMKVSDNGTAEGTVRVRTDAVLSAMDDAVKIGADVVNLSFGSYEFFENEELFEVAFKKMQNSGISIVGASGNGGHNASGTGQSLYAGDAFYGTENMLSKIGGIISAGSSDNPVEIKHFFVIDGKKYYYKEKNSITLYSVSNVLESMSEESGEETVTSEEAGTEEAADGIVGEDSLVEASEADIENSLPEDDKKTNEYVYADTYDVAAAFDGKSLSGKLLILDISEMTDWKSACSNALNSGISALALMNAPTGLDYEGVIPEEVPFMILDDDMSAELNEKPSGAYIPDQYGEISDKEGTVGISSFTSYAADEALRIGKRLVAPGDEVFLPSINGEYEYLTGSSASAAVISGVCAVIRQGLKEKGLLENKNAEETRLLTEAILLSHAKPVAFGTQNEEDVLYYSPRLQGFGMPDISEKNDMHAYLAGEAYITEGGTLKKSGDGGAYEFSFNVVSFSDKPANYRLSYAVQTDTGYLDGRGNAVNSLRPHSLLSRSRMTFYSEGEKIESLHVEGGETVLITAVLEFDEGVLEDRIRSFSSGYYLDGYVFLESEEGEAMNMPFTGYYGSLENVSPFDNTIYDIDDSITGLDSSFVAVAFKDGRYESCQLAQSEDCLLFSKDAVRDYTDDSGYGASFILPDFYFLRSAHEFVIKIYDSSQKLLYSENFGSISTYREADRHPYEKLIRKSDGLRQFFSELRDGRYKYEVSVRAMTPEGNLSYLYTDAYWFESETEKPKVKAPVTYLKDGKTYLELTSSDKNGIKEFVLYAAAYDPEKKSYNYIDQLKDIVAAGYMKDDSYVLLERTTNEDGSQTFLYDISRLRRELSRLSVNTDAWTSQSSDKKIAFRAIDNSYNASEVKMADTLEYGSAEFVFTDQNGKPSKGITVIMGEESAVSDREGRAVVKLLEPDYYHAIIRYDKNVYSLSKDSFLIAISNGELNVKTEVKTVFSGEYTEEEEPSQEEVSRQPVSSPSNDDDRDEPAVAFAFIGFMLLICVGLFAVGKNIRMRI